MKIEVEESPDNFRCGDIAAVNEFLDLVPEAMLEHSTVMALVNVLVDIFQ